MQKQPIYMAIKVTSKPAKRSEEPKKKKYNAAKSKVWMKCWFTEHGTNGEKNERQHTHKTTKIQNKNATLQSKVPNMWHIFINLSYLFRALYFFLFFSSARVNVCQISIPSKRCATYQTQFRLRTKNSYHVPGKTCLAIHTFHVAITANPTTITTPANKNVANFSHSFRV